MLVIVFLTILLNFLTAKTVMLIGVATLLAFGCGSLIYFCDAKNRIHKLLFGLIALIGIGLAINKANAQSTIQPGAIKHLLKEFSQDGHYQNLTHLSAGVSFRDEANPLTLNYLLATGKRPIVVRFREGEKIQVVQNYLLDRRVFVFSPPVTKHHISVLATTLGFDDTDTFIYSIISLARRKVGVTNERFDTTRFAHNDKANLFKNVEFYKDRPSDVSASNERYTRVSGELWRRRTDVKKEISGEIPPRN